ncbi:MAG: hypothetical protein ACFFC1_21855 [Promethearchaeota archaeon]
MKRDDKCSTVQILVSSRSIISDRLLGLHATIAAVSNATISEIIIG